MAKTYYQYLNDHSYDELWTIAVHHLGIPNTQVNSISQKSYLAVLVMERTTDEKAVRSALRSLVGQKRNFRRERKLMFPRGR
jgi:hypothetical protein